MRKFVGLILIFSSFSSFGQSADTFEFFLSERAGKIPCTYSSADNLYMRDMVVDPPQKIIIGLTKEERDLILKKVESINFFAYPDVYKFQSEDSTKSVSPNPPCTIINLSVFINGTSKYVSWNNCITGVQSKNNLYENLEDLRGLIDKLLLEKESYKKSKPPRK
jgi:hypothetical protein